MPDPTADAPAFDESEFSDLLYEYQMFVRTGKMWASTGAWANPAAQYAVMESCLVHARNLHTFLRSPPATPKPGDYFASHFVPGFGRSVYTDEEIKKINRWLQHLTTYRYVDDDHPSWDLRAIFSPMVDAMGAFLEEVDESIKRAFRDTHMGALRMKAALEHMPPDD